MDKKRLTNWWIRWEDLKWPSPDVLDRIKYKADKYVEANISTAVIYGCHFRWDYMPFFTLLHDYLGTVAEELHQRGIQLYDHHSVNLIHRYDTKEEMRHVMMHSGPHIPFCPSREAAATWEFKGKRLNDWRMVDVKTRDVLYFPQYASEGFCHRNPEFKEAYQQYAKQLVADTGIDGLMADDAMYYMHFNACGCEHCRAELKRRSGIDLPPIEDQTFWGNFDNPAFRDWIDLRFDATAEFHRDLRKVLPEEFALMSCGASSATSGALGSGSDARKFLGGCNYVNQELCGNTPAYKHDPVTVNSSISHKIINASHHQAAAKEQGVRCYGTGYGFTEPSANIIWAVNRFLDADCHFSTLKPRLGLPDAILDTLPEEYDVVGKAYGFEKDHENLFAGEMLAQVGVYFSYETRNHTCFGYMSTGYTKDFQNTLQTLFKEGISADTIFSFPKDVKQYPVILLSSVLSMTDAEIAAMNAYLAAGGKVIVTGPSKLSQCENSWQLSNQADVDPEGFFSTIRDGVWHKPAAWLSNPQPVCPDENKWTQSGNLFYNPQRFSDIADSVLELCKVHGRPLPIRVLQSEGYLIAMYEDKDGITVHFLAADFDTDIDHHLDEIRFHRSRVNYINKVEPIGVDSVLRIQADSAPTVYTPFQSEASSVECDGDTYMVTLPDKCAYALLRFQK